VTPKVKAAPALGQISSGERIGRQRRDSLGHQRAQLLTAMVSIVSHGGYARASIGELARRAGVSRGTFYEIFREKEECFLAAFTEHAERLEREIEANMSEASGRALELVVDRLCMFAGAEPETFNFMFHESLLAGPKAGDLREAVIIRLHQLVRTAEAPADEESGTLDAPAELLLSAVLRLLTMHVNRDCLDSDGMRPELRDWLSFYRAPSGPFRWRTLEPVAELMRSHVASADSMALRRTVPKGRHGLSNEALRALQKERIAHGTAEAIRAHGYAEATVSDIVACAGVSRDVFYAEFRDKHEAFNEAAKLVFEHLLATMASAYYGSAAPWPERVWSAGEGFARFLEEEPVLAYFLFVGTSAPHPQVDRVNEYILAFRVFIDDGFEHSRPGATVPEIASEALVSAVLAIVTYLIRHERTRELRGLIPVIVYVVLAPFLGREEAAGFVQERTAAAVVAA
jgi:AcrR family transcriptional regulator